MGELARSVWPKWRRWTPLLGKRRKGLALTVVAPITYKCVYAESGVRLPTGVHVIISASVRHLVYTKHASSTGRGDGRANRVDRWQQK